jgi:hypothetical protein
MGAGLEGSEIAKHSDFKRLINKLRDNWTEPVPASPGVARSAIR